MKVLVCGGRDYADKAHVFRVLDSAHRSKPITVLIHGGAKGADTLAANWALFRGIAVERYQAEWKLYGKSAGRVRNHRMLAEGNAELVIAFPGGTGTEHMCMIAKDAGIPVRHG